MTSDDTLSMDGLSLSLSFLRPNNPKTPRLFFFSFPSSSVDSRSLPVPDFMGWLETTVELLTGAALSLSLPLPFFFVASCCSITALGSDPALPEDGFGCSSRIINGVAESFRVLVASAMSTDLLGGWRKKACPQIVYPTNSVGAALAEILTNRSPRKSSSTSE